MQHVAITGANGFIGKNLLQYLSDAGYLIHAFVGDVTKADDVAKLPKNLIAVIHCAGVNRCDDVHRMLDVNALGTYNVAVHCLRNKIRLLVTGTILTEGMYGASKRLAMNIITSLGNVGLDGAYLKLCNVYGPMGKPFYNSFANTIMWCIANEQPYRHLVQSDDLRLSLIHVNDVCQNIDGLLRMHDIAIGGGGHFENGSRVIDFCLATDFSINVWDFIAVAEGKKVPTSRVSTRNVNMIQSTVEIYRRDRNGVSGSQ